MAIAQDIYARTRDCAAKAAETIERLRSGRVPDPLTVRARHTAADIAADALYAQLLKAFLTPIDREDLWLIHTAGEAVYEAAEAVSLCVYHGGRAVPVRADKALCALSACCDVCVKAVTAFGEVSRAAPWRQVLREAEEVLHRTMHDSFADATVRRLVTQGFALLHACERLITALRYAGLKNG